MVKLVNREIQVKEVLLALKAKWVILDSKVKLVSVVTLEDRV